MMLNAYFHFYRYEIYVLFNIIAIFLTLYFQNSTIAKLSFFIAMTFFVINLPLVADSVYYNEGFIANGYSGSKYEYLWRLPQNVLSIVGLKEYTLIFFRILALILLALVLKLECGTYLALASNASILITQNGLRQGISSLIVCFIFSELKLTRMLLISVAAGLIHTSGFVFGVLASVFAYTYRNCNFKTLLIDGPFLCHAYTVMALFLAMISPTLLTYFDYGNYLRVDGEMAGRVTGAYKYVLYILDAMILVFIAYKNANYKSPNIVSIVSLCLVLLSVVFGCYWGAHDLASRLLLTATIWITVGYGFILYNISTFKRRALVALIVAVRSMLSINVIKLLSL